MPDWCPILLMEPDDFPRRTVLTVARELFEVKLAEASLYDKAQSLAQMSPRRAAPAQALGVAA